MKKIVLFFAILLLCSCSKRATPIDILEVQPHHATRAIVLILYDDGTIRKVSYHHSETLVIGNKQVHVSEYISGKKPYGKVK